MFAPAIGMANLRGGRTKPTELTRSRSLLALIDSRLGRPRWLKPLDVPQPQPDRAASPNPTDPLEPVRPGVVIEHLAHEEVRKHVHPRLLWLGALLIAMTAFAAAWQWTPMQEWIDLRRVASVAPRIRSTPFAPLIVLGTYVGASLVAVPVTALIFATALVFGPWWGIVYSLAGALVSGSVTFAIGRYFGAGGVAMQWRRLEELMQKICDRGWPTMAVVRFLPIAPFTVVNIVAGASPMRFHEFLLGSTIGMLPSVVAISIFESRLETAIRTPGPGSWVLLGIVAALLGLAFVWLRRNLRTRDADNEQERPRKKTA